MLLPSALHLMFEEEPCLTACPRLLFPRRPLSFEEFKKATTPEVVFHETEDERNAAKLALSIEADILGGLEGMLQLKTRR